MSDIVERLRREVSRNGDIGLQQEAAAEIDRLRTDLDRALAMNIATEKEKGKCIEEIVRLREELDVFQKSYLEVSKIVRRQGSEEWSLADQIKQLCAERDKLLAGLNAVAALKALTGGK